MNLTADHLLGRRYTLERHGRMKSDITVVVVDPDRGVKLHGTDGSKSWFTLDQFGALLQAGAIFDSANGAGFVWD
jgi:hypothetical protein